MILRVRISNDWSILTISENRLR